jgi:hypothetical protein
MTESVQVVAVLVAVLKGRGFNRIAKSVPAALSKPPESRV